MKTADKMKRKWLLRVLASQFRLKYLQNRSERRLERKIVHGFKGPSATLYIGL